MRPLAVCDLFSGIGGFSLAAHSLGMETVAFCECEPYPVRVLNRHFPGVPVFPDVKELTADALADTMREQRREVTGGAYGDEVAYAGRRTSDDDQPIGSRSGSCERIPRAAVDIICGGFPCQDLSYAGKGAGLQGARSGLFFEVVRLIGDIRPRFVLLENVAALLTRGADVVLGALAEVGYDAVWGVVRASDVGAPHRRERIWIVAYPEGTADGVAIANHVRARLTPFGSETWPTATANDYKNAGYQSANRRDYMTLPGATGSATVRGETWPTATASDAWSNELDREGMVGKHNLGLGTAARINGTWPTPRANKVQVDNEQAQNRIDSTGYHRNIEEAVALESFGAGGSLNPDWVDSLMGYPVGYSLPEGEPMLTLPNVWPAGLGAPQHEWEPPRLTTVKEHRANRLKADGNSIVPQIARLWLEAIQEQIEEGGL